MVLAFAGDSTMTIFMSFQWLTGKIKAGSARLASAVSERTWVVRGPLSNRQMLKVGLGDPVLRPISCKIRPMVAILKRVWTRNTRFWIVGPKRLHLAQATARWRRFARGLGLTAISPLF